MPKLIMLVGLPGSGKSTWTNKFLSGAKEDYVVVSSDNILDEMAAEHGITYAESFNKFAKIAMKRMNQVLEDAVNDGKNIIWDQTNMTRKSRVSKMAKAPGYTYEAVVFLTTDAELNRRLVGREKETGKHIPDFVVKNMANRYVPPSKEEGFSKVTVIRS